MSEKKEFDCGVLGGATEVAFCFDTTGSMQPCIANVRKKIEQTCEELFSEIPDLKVGMIAHGDYCDEPKCMTVLELTNDRSKIFDFIRNAPNTGGGDAPECYEYALNKSRELGWSNAGKSGRALVLIGDDEPHKFGEHRSPGHYPSMMMSMEGSTSDLSDQGSTVEYDWRKELDALLEMGVKVYPMQCLYRDYRNEVNRFWSQIAEICNTALIRLDDFNESSEALTGLAFAAAGSEYFDKYEAKLSASDCDVSESTKARNMIYRAEAAKYDDLRSSE